MNMHGKNYFSISSEHIPVANNLIYDIYINSSLNVQDHFVKIYSKGEILTQEDINLMAEKYMTVYLSEESRNLYLLSLHLNDNLSLVEKGNVIKDNAVKYLDDLFNHKNQSNEYLQQSLGNCQMATKSMVELIKDYGFTDIQELIGNLSFHDFYTYDHSINVSMYNILQYKSLKPEATEDELIIAGLSGMLHDLGKIRLSTDIINKSEKLTVEEFDEIKLHPQHGKDIINEYCSCGSVDMTEIIKVIYEHHENYNGTGYPNKISGQNISLLARITAISDFYDAITTKRSYHEALSTDKALLLMNQSVGKKIDPQLFKNFVNQISKVINLNIKFDDALPDSFDPCQPRAKLELIKKSHLNLFKNDENKFGDVIIVEFPKFKKIS